MPKKSHEWVFTAKRKQSLVKARKEHQYLVSLGKRAKVRGIK